MGATVVSDRGGLPALIGTSNRFIKNEDKNNIKSFVTASLKLKKAYLWMKHLEFLSASEHR